MKLIYLPLLVGTLGISSVWQFQESQSPPDVSVVKSSWNKELIGWEGDPFSGPLENFDEMRARARNEKLIDDAKRGGAGDVDRIKQVAQADAAIVEKTRRKGPARYRFVYKTRFSNTGNKTIDSIDWDYVFRDAVTGEELGRREFGSDENIAPGKSKELSFTISRPPTQRISVYALEKKEREGLIEQVLIIRVQYSDGSVWQLP